MFMPCCLYGGQRTTFKGEVPGNIEFRSCDLCGRCSLSHLCQSMHKQSYNMGFYSLSNGQALENFCLGSDLKQLEMLLASSWGSMTEQMLVLSPKPRGRKQQLAGKLESWDRLSFQYRRDCEIVSPRNNREYTHNI